MIEALGRMQEEGPQYPIVEDDTHVAAAACLSLAKSGAIWKGGDDKKEAVLGTGSQLMVGNGAQNRLETLQSLANPTITSLGLNGTDAVNFSLMSLLNSFSNQDKKNGSSSSCSTTTSSPRPLQQLGSSSPTSCEILPFPNGFLFSQNNNNGIKSEGSTTTTTGDLGGTASSCLVKNNSHNNGNDDNKKDKDKNALQGMYLQQLSFQLQSSLLQTILNGTISPSNLSVHSNNSCCAPSTAPVSPTPDSNKSNEQEDLGAPAAALKMDDKQRSSSCTIVQGSFKSDDFSPRYQRNNKRGGLKNLRCFPSCGKIHRDRGFCGRSAFATVKRSEQKVSLKGVKCWAQFVCIDQIRKEAGKPRKQQQQNDSHKELNIECDPSAIKVGDEFELADLQALERTRESRINPWLRGEYADMTRCHGGGEDDQDSESDDAATHSKSKEETIRITPDMDQVTFEFNRQRWGWHYGWVSNKHSCDSKHCLKCFIFLPKQGTVTKYVCVGTFYSPDFVLFCRRRRRFMQELAKAEEESEAPAEKKIVLPKRPATIQRGRSSTSETDHDEENSDDSFPNAKKPRRC